MDTLTSRLRRCLRTMAVLLTAVILLNSCTTPRNTLSGSGAGSLATSRMAALASPLSGHTDLTMRMAMDASFDGKTLPIKGNLRMRRGEVVQMAFTALGMIEVARIEATPEAVWVIDRMGKQYARMAWKDIPLVGGSLVDYSLMESLLWNELFIPGTKPSTLKSDQFVVEAAGDGQCIHPRSQKLLQCRFWSDDSFSRLRRTRLQLGRYASEWAYSGYQQVDDVRYPSSLNASLEMDGKAANAAFTFSSIALDNHDWAPRTNLSNYTAVSFDELLSRLSILKQ